MKFALLLLLAALVGSGAGTIMFPRGGCGCARNPVARKLTVEEILRLRAFVLGLGIKHANVLTDISLQAIFRFSILNNFPDVVPSKRSGMLEIITQGLSELTDKVLPDAVVIARIVKFLSVSVPELATIKLNVDLSSLVPASAVILHQRGVTLTHAQLQVFIKGALSAYLQSPAYKAEYGPLAQLVATLDHFDHQLPSILQLAALLPVRRRLEKRFNLKNDIFDHRFRQAVKQFENNRRRILNSFHTIAYRGARFEITIQQVITKVVEFYPGASKASIRAILNILQLTNTKGGRASPRDLLAIIAFPQLEVSIRDIDIVIARRVWLHLPEVKITYQQVREAYALYIIGLVSQGIQPVKLSLVHDSFIRHTQRFFLGVSVYSAEAYILYVIRVVVPSIPRGSPGFIIRLFDATVVVDNVLVPEPLQSIYQEGRNTIIPRIFGLQGNSIQITKRLARGEGAKPVVKNIVNLGPRIVNGPLPTEDKFSYSGVLLSAVQLQAVSAVLEARFSALKARHLQLPLIKLIIDADIIDGSGETASAALRRLFAGLPDFQVSASLGPLVTQLSTQRLVLTEQQLLAGLQQFYVATRALGIVIPTNALQSIFAISLTQYVATLPKIPAQPFDIGFLQYLRARLTIIIQSVVLVGDSVPLLGPQLDKIFSVFPGLVISPGAQRAIIRFIYSSDLIKVEIKSASAAVKILGRVLAGISDHYSHDAYILGDVQLQLLLKELIDLKIKISIQQLRDANALALLGLGLHKRLDVGLTSVQVRIIIRRAIVLFLRVNKVSNIASEDFFRALFATVKVSLPELPVPQPPVYQKPEPYVPPPVIILPGLSLSVKRVEFFISVLRRRFTFVTFDNVQPILAHIITILRSRGEKITQEYLDEALTVYITALPKFGSVKGLDLSVLLKRIDTHLIDVTITGIGIQSAFVELYLSLHALKLPLPSVEVRNDFFTLIVTLYGRTFTRQQIRFGEPFYKFLSTYLPKLSDYSKPFPLFALPQLFFALEAQLKPAILPVSDISILIRVIVQANGLKLDGLTLVRLLGLLRGSKKVSIAGPLVEAELKVILAHVRQAGLKVSQRRIRRAFLAVRLALRFIDVRLSRKLVIQTFSRLVVKVGSSHPKLLVPELATSLVASLRIGDLTGKLGGDIGGIKIDTDFKKGFGNFFGDGNDNDSD